MFPLASFTTISIPAVALSVLKNIDEIGICRLTSNDVVRHPLVQKIVKAYEIYESKEKSREKQGHYNKREH